MDNNLTANVTMVEDELHSKIEFLRIYGTHIHAYLALTLCIVGSIFNTFNLIVYTRRNMISPINTILTYLAVADFFVLLLYIPRLWYEYLSAGVIPEDYQNSFEGELLILGYTYVIVYFINVTTWLTVAISVFRWISIAYPLRNDDWGNLKTVRVVVAVIFVASLLFQLVDFIFVVMTSAEYYEVELLGVLINDSGTKDMLKFTSRIYAITTGVVFRIIPSILIAIFSVRLAFVLLEVKKLHRTMTTRSSANSNIAKGEKQMNRTTLMLFMLSLLSLMTLVPRGILHSSYFINEQFYHQLELNTKEILQLLVLINSTFPFVVYYGIGKKFRDTFDTMFRRNARDLLSRFSSMTNRS